MANACCGWSERARPDAAGKMARRYACFPHEANPSMIHSRPRVAWRLILFYMNTVSDLGLDLEKLFQPAWAQGKGAKQKRVEISKVTSLKNLKLAEHVAANHISISRERLSPEAWSLKSDAGDAGFAKVTNAGKPPGDYIERKIFYGLKTGLNKEAESP